MTTARLVVSPGENYAKEMLASLSQATSFTLVTGFASVAGVQLIEPAVRSVLERGGQGRIILAVDRRGFNAAAVFEVLLALKQAVGAKLSVGVVLEGAGLLHAKALFTEGPTGDQLLVGSANLTRSALGMNHELGVLLAELSGDLRQAFRRFVTSIAPRSLDGPDARDFLVSRGLLQRPRTSPPRPQPGALPPISETFGRMPPLPPMDMPAEEHLAAWIGRGYIVGRGRRSLDALVLRLPQEQLVKHGHIRARSPKMLGPGSHETQTMGYGVDLIPTAESETLRRDARRVSLLLAKLTLNLPCFGLWMPESYWETFLDAREALHQAGSLAPGQVLDAATRQRQYLTDGGLEIELDRIVARLRELDLLLPDKGADLKAFIIPRFRGEMGRRTPEVLETCIEFRTARQRWTPYENTEVPYRQLMVDVMQATFAATYRTGDWPRRFRSHASRTVAECVEARLADAGREADGEMAVAILDRASRWEDMERPMSAVCDEFRTFVEDDLQFPPPEVAVLASNIVASPADDDDEGTDDDGQ